MTRRTDPGVRTGPGPLARWLAAPLLGLVRVYQVLLSPLMGGRCRFEPSCSRYAAESLRTHGAFRGCWLAAVRLAKCHPLGSSGYDPVPPPSEGREAGASRGTRDDADA